MYLDQSNLVESIIKSLNNPLDIVGLLNALQVIIEGLEQGISVKQLADMTEGLKKQWDSYKESDKINQIIKTQFKCAINEIHFHVNKILATCCDAFNLINDLSNFRENINNTSVSDQTKTINTDREGQQQPRNALTIAEILVTANQTKLGIPKLYLS